TTNTSAGAILVGGSSNYTVTLTPQPSANDLMVVWHYSGNASTSCMVVFFWTGGIGNLTTMHMRKGFIRFNEADASGVDFNQGTTTGFSRINSGTDASNILTSVSSTSFVTANGVGLQIKRGPRGGGSTLTCSSAGNTIDINGDVDVATS